MLECLKIEVEYKGNQKWKKCRSKLKYKYIIFHKDGHFNKVCLERGKMCYSIQIVIVSNGDGYKSDDVLMVTGLEKKNSWIMDYKCPNHTCLRNEYFETLKLK